MQAADLGGFSGTAVIGHGTLLTGITTSLVSDCTVTVQGGTITLSSASGAFTSSATFTGAATDTIQIISTPTDTQYSFKPSNGKVIMTVNDFGFVSAANSNIAGSGLQCP